MNLEARIEKHGSGSISVSISSNVLDNPIFLCDKVPEILIIDFVANLVLLAEKIKAKMHLKIL